jgi:hypothetical protein
MIKRNERSLRIDIKPEIPQKKKLADQFKRVKELAVDYTHVVWIIDLDTVLSENTLDEFLKQKDQLESSKRFANVAVIINQPCLEYWLLLHFECVSPHFTNCTQAADRLKKHLPDYSKSQTYYTKQGNDIYLKLKPRLHQALENTQKLAPFDREAAHRGLSEMDKLFDILGIDE